MFFASDFKLSHSAERFAYNVRNETSPRRYIKNVSLLLLDHVTAWLVRLFCLVFLHKHHVTVMYHISTSSISDVSDVFCCFPTFSVVSDVFPLFPMLSVVSDVFHCFRRFPLFPMFSVVSYVFRIFPSISICILSYPSVSHIRIRPY